MVDYPKMYAVLCGAVDEAIQMLESIPQAKFPAHALQIALQRAEDIYIETAEASDDANESSPE